MLHRQTQILTAHGWQVLSTAYAPVLFTPYFNGPLKLKKSWGRKVHKTQSGLLIQSRRFQRLACISSAPVVHQSEEGPYTVSSASYMRKRILANRADIRYRLKFALRKVRDVATPSTVRRAWLLELLLQGLGCQTIWDSREVQILLTPALRRQQPLVASALGKLCSYEDAFSSLGDVSPKYYVRLGIPRGRVRVAGCEGSAEELILVLWEALSQDVVSADTADAWQVLLGLSGIDCAVGRDGLVFPSKRASEYVAQAPEQLKIMRPQSIFTHEAGYVLTRYLGGTPVWYPTNAAELEIKND